MSENINTIIKESIKIAKEKISTEIAKIEEKENYTWGDFWNLTFQAEHNLKEQNPDLVLSEQEEIIRKSYEKSIESILKKKDDFESLHTIYDGYSQFEYEHGIGDYELRKMLQAVENAKKAGNFENAARYISEAEIIKKTVELKQRGKELLKCRDGAVILRKFDGIIAPESWSFGRCFGDNTDYNIFGSLCPIYDFDWIPNRNGWQVLREYKDSDFKALCENFDADNRIYKVLFSRTPETIKIGDKIYKDCLRVLYRRELDGETGDRFFDRFKTDNVWYAPDVGIVKVTHTAPMEDKITYYLDDYKVNGEGIGNKYMPIAEGNYWSYKAAGGNVAEQNIYNYLNKFTVTRADGDTAALSHLGWIFER
jgi:hypothetical protein